MDPLKDTEFYNEISSTYSRDRYPEKPRSYGQFFFIHRLFVVLEVLRKKISTTAGTSSLLEVGCADGIVIGTIYDTFPTRFSLLRGVDPSPDMIGVAKTTHAQTPITFSVRDKEGDGGPYDFVIEIGVINYTDPAEEIMKASTATKDTGYYIASYAGSDSLWHRLKPGKKGFHNLLSYKDFEALLQKHFAIEWVISIGFFVPRIWRFPALAAPLQAVVESLGSRLLPRFAHEKIYILKKST